MSLTMVKKRLADGSECRKCVEATEYLTSKGLWNRVDQIVWAHESDPASAGMQLGLKHRVDSAPFFIVDDGRGEVVYTSVLQLIRERLGQEVSAVEQAAAIDADDIGI